MRDDDDKPRTIMAHYIGQALDTLSGVDLADRSARLRHEIARLEAARQAKVAALGAADAFFKR